MGYKMVLESSDYEKAMYYFAAALALFLFWLLVRELVCWYYKTSEIVKLLQEENKQLREQNTYLYQISLNTYTICQQNGTNVSTTPTTQVQQPVQQMNTAAFNSMGAEPVVPSNPSSVNPMNTNTQS
ncbi:MAG: hypothetical protein J5653_05755 [Clostridiales bacterium]|nr:hypothetical protein [Clostridiales bacterium]